MVIILHISGEILIVKIGDHKLWVQ